MTVALSSTPDGLECLDALILLRARVGGFSTAASAAARVLAYLKGPRCDDGTR